MTDAIRNCKLHTKKAQIPIYSCLYLVSHSNIINESGKQANLFRIEKYTETLHPRFRKNYN